MTAEITVQQYKPSEIISIFNEILSYQNERVSGRLVSVRGLYLVGNGVAYGGMYYDTLRDESTPVELTIKIGGEHRRMLTPGNLVEILGTLGRRITQKGEIRLELGVTRVEVLHEQVVDENEAKLIELRQRKVVAGFKNVDNIIETLLYGDERPQVALLVASGSKTFNDFEDGLRAARASIDFREERVSFAQTYRLVAKLRELDHQGYHAIALVRGGGIDPATDVDKPEVIEAVVALHTAFISAVGHKDEKIFLRQVADKWTATPQGLGQYFSDVVEEVAQRKSKSHAVLAEQIKKHYQQQIEAGQKQNRELQDKLQQLTKVQAEAAKQHAEQIKTLTEAQKAQVEALTKAQAEADKKHGEQLEAMQRQHKEQIDKATKQNADLQEKLSQITRANEEAQRQHGEQIGHLHLQMTQQIADLYRQAEGVQTSLREMQLSNGELLAAVRQLLQQDASQQINTISHRLDKIEQMLADNLNKQ